MDSTVLHHTRLAKTPADGRDPAPESPPHEVKALAVVLREEFGVCFRFHDASTGALLLAPDPQDSASCWAAEACQAAVALAGDPRPRVVPASRSSYLIVFPLAGLGPSHMAALGALPALARTRDEAKQERDRIERWARAVHDRLVGAQDISDCQRSHAELDRRSMIAWEALIALDRLHRGTRIHKEPTRERRRILRGAGELLRTQAMAWIPAGREDEVVLEGERLLSPWDCGQLAAVLASQPSWKEAGFLLVNDARESSWGARFPQILNLLAIPVEDRRLSGWLLAFNRRRGPARPTEAGASSPGAAASRPGSSDHPGVSIRPFRRSDAALLMPFASLVGLHVTAARRYLHIKDLLVGLTRSLTSAIDAKDAYTYGHSERVARVAVELGRDLGLQEDELSDIYLAGLLHDIGKIGVRDDVLTKRGPLTDEEFKHIQQHVIIGHRILADLHAISHLLPGVLYHHERYDGDGYPEGLRGDAIPLLARILAVADSFDAMNTSRPYRKAMPVERVDQILREGAGTQWDPLVIDAYVRCRDRLMEIRQRGLGESLCNAIDGALRHGPGTNIFASMEMSMIE